MLPQEADRWDQYIDRYGLPEGDVEYDVHLGEGAPVDSSWPEWMVRMVKVLSTHRVDVIVERPGEVLIIEVKYVAGMGALGQLLGYEALWLQERGTDRPVRLLLVCERLEADMMAAFNFYEVAVIELGESG